MRAWLSSSGKLELARLCVFMENVRFSQGRIIGRSSKFSGMKKKREEEEIGESVYIRGLNPQLLFS